MGVEKMSVSFDLELGEAIKASATSSSQSVSAWLAQAARDRLRLDAVADAVSGWERKFGSLTDAEIGAADRLLEDAAEKHGRGAA